MGSPLANKAVMFTQEEKPEENPVDIDLKEIEDTITNILRQIDVQERPTREILIKIWKYLDLLWTGIANFYWNSTSNQWKPITYDDVRHLSENSDIDPTLLNKTINMIRPYGESIVGVLTTTLPRNKYYPADADSIDDINTAKAYCSIERKISQDNFMKTKIVQMIVNLLTGGFFAAYNYSHSDEKYGTVEEPQMESKNYRISSYTCPECGNEILQDKNPIDTLDNASGAELGLSEGLNEDFESKDLGEDAAQEEEEAQVETLQCPNCGTQAPPITETINKVVQEQVGTKIIPKKRQIIEIYGPLQVKIPTHASKKEEVLWCVLEDEVHESLARTLYPNYRDRIKPGSHTDLAYDRWARSQYENMGELNQYYLTIRKVWLRPSAYEILDDKDKAERLRNFYPSGLMAVFANHDFLFAEAAEIDDCWTFSLNPIYRRLYGDPLLKAAIPLQESANDLFQLELETVRYSIPQTFADPERFDFEAYAQTKAQPGLVYPMKPGSSGQAPLSAAMFETRTASLPDEVEVLEGKIEKLFQFILGVFPSIFGGPSSGSKTLGEYEQSRGQALQRLNINPWEVVNTAHAEMMAKAVKAYADDLLEDEAFVEAKGNSFINVWIKKADLQGRIGEVKPELSDQFPTSWGQKKAAYLELIGLNNPVITNILFHPENIGLLSELMSIDDLYVPGDDQRNKQLEEIRNLITQAPMTDPMGNPISSSVPIEPIDDDNIHIQVLSAFICSEIGQSLKTANPAGYANLMAHNQEHQTRLQMIAQQQAQAQAEAQPPQKGESQPVQESK